MIRVGLIGAGIIGTRLKNRFMREEDIEITWICDINLESTRLLSQDTNAKLTKDYNDLLNDPKIDFVYIGVPPKWHKEIAVKALELNKHIIQQYFVR